MTNLLYLAAIFNGLAVAILAPSIGPWIWPGIILEGALIGWALANERIEKQRRGL